MLCFLSITSLLNFRAYWPGFFYVFQNDANQVDLSHMSTTKPKFITAFTYGGGLRGIIPATVMAHIETTTGLRMAQMVDLFTGPSTGSILNAALTRPHRRRKGISQYKARHMVRFYEREARNIFPIDRFRDFRGLLHDFNNRTIKIGKLSKVFRHGHYNPENLRKALYALYGDAKMEDAIASLIVPTYNIAGMALEIGQNDGQNLETKPSNHLTDHGGRSVWIRHLLKNTYNPKNHKTIDVSLFDAVMASCAAPSYFPCHDFSAFDPNDNAMRNYHAIDGFIFDNPCVSYNGVIRPHAPKDQELHMLIFGTGHTGRSMTKDEWDRFGALGVVDPVNDYPLINIFLHASESALTKAFIDEIGKENLHIFNKSIYDDNNIYEPLPSQEIDDATPENLQRLKSFARAIIEENKNKLDDTCQMLVQNYEAKAKKTDDEGSIFARVRRNFFSEE
jgi:predicted acylesterase/phospholipase RssA